MVNPTQLEMGTQSDIKVILKPSFGISLIFLFAQRRMV